MVRGTRSAYFPVLNETGVSDVPRLASAPMSRAPPFLAQSVAGNQRSASCESGTRGYRLASRTPTGKRTSCKPTAASGCSSSTPRESTSPRPELDRALAELRAGDTLVVTKLDRLGRSLQHLLELSAALQERGVDLVVLQQGIDTSTPTGRLFFQIIAAIAEFERELNHERTVDGLAAARARGRTGGQKPKLTARQVELVREAYDARDSTVAQVASDFGVTRSTIYRALAHTEAAAR